MKIYVCTKSVADTAVAIKLVDDTHIQEEDIKFIMNPYDEFALEEALQLKEKVGEEAEVILVSYGNNSIVEVLLHGLAMGADRSIRINTTNLFNDHITIAAVLAAAIKKDGEPSIIFTGQHTIDVEGMQTAYRLAAELDLPIVSNVMNFEYNGDKVMVDREIEGGDKEIYEVSLPCVIAAKRGLNEPRYPKLPDRMKAKKKPVTVYEIADLGVEESSAVSLTKFILPPDKPPAKIIGGSPAEAARELVRVLKEEERVL